MNDKQLMEFGTAICELDTLLSIHATMLFNLTSCTENQIDIELEQYQAALNKLRELRQSQL